MITWNLTGARTSTCSPAVLPDSVNGNPTLQLRKPGSWVILALFLTCHIQSNNKSCLLYLQKLSIWPLLNTSVNSTWARATSFLTGLLQQPETSFFVSWLHPPCYCLVLTWYLEWSFLCLLGATENFLFSTLKNNNTWTPLLVFKVKSYGKCPPHESR